MSTQNCLQLFYRRLKLSLYNRQTVTVYATVIVNIIVLIFLLTDSNNGAGQAGGQSQDMPGLDDVVAALFLESDDPNQTKKIQFENNFQIPEDKFPAEKEKILLLAYSRAGSSFVGQLLSASNTASYYYEPLYCLRPNGTIVERAVQGNTFNRELVGEMVRRIFDCDTNILSELDKTHFPAIQKNGQICGRSSPRVVKTTRLRFEHLESWIENSDIKIIHLIRDPRAILNSVSAKADIWLDFIHNASLLCTQMESDSLLANILPMSRYLQVKYEDLIDNPLAEVKRLYSFMNTEISQEVTQFLTDHTGKASNSEYYGTFRGKDFQPDHWKTQMGLERVREIEAHCWKVLKEGGYPIMEGV